MYYINGLNKTQINIFSNLFQRIHSPLKLGFRRLHVGNHSSDFSNDRGKDEDSNEKVWYLENVLKVGLWLFMAQQMLKKGKKWLARRNHLGANILEFHRLSRGLRLTSTLSRYTITNLMRKMTRKKYPSSEIREFLSSRRHIWKYPPIFSETDDSGN